MPIRTRFVFLVATAACCAVSGCSTVPAPPVPPAKWDVSKGYTPQNREVRGAMIADVESSNTYESSTGLKFTSKLSVHCEKNLWGVFVGLTEGDLRPEAGTDNYTVSYDLDGAAAPSTIGKPIGRYLYIGNKELVQRLIRADRFTFRFTTLEAKPAALDFDLRGLRAAVAALRVGCGSSVI